MSIKNDITVLWHELESWQRDNPSIIAGYRPESNSYWTSIGSLFYLHNETVNIYSHFLGAVAFAITGVVLYRRLTPRYATASMEDFFVFACFFVSCIVCLTTSGAYHLVSNHSHAVAVWGNRADYLGIVFLIWGSFVPCIYYGFQERLNLVWIYICKISLIALATGYTCIAPSFHTPELRAFRAGLFVAMGLSAIIPVVHGLLIFDAAHIDRCMSLRWVVAQGALYIAGAGLYASRTPERKWPGTFDVFGASHQIFHLLVVTAAAVHLRGIVLAFHHKHQGRYAAVRLFDQSRVAKKTRLE